MAQRYFMNGGGLFSYTAGVSRWANPQSTEGGAGGVSSGFQTRQYIPPNSGITIKEFRFAVGTAPGGTDTLRAVLQKNGVDTEFDITLTGTDTVATDTGSVTFAAGDYIELKTTTSATTTAANPNWTIIYEADGGAINFGVAQGTITGVTTQFPILGRNAQQTTSPYNDGICSIDGTINDAVVQLETAPGVGTSRTFTLLKNGVGTACAITISGTNKSGTVSSAAVDIAPGDALRWEMTVSGAAANSHGSISLGIIPDTPGHQPLFSVTTPFTSGATRYSRLNAGRALADLTETNTNDDYLPPCTLSHMYVVLQTAPGSGGDAYTITLRSGAANTAIACTISDSATTGNDTTDTVTVTGGSGYCFQGAPVNVPANNAGNNTGIGIRATIPPDWVPKTIII